MFRWGTGDKISMLFKIHILPERNLKTECVMRSCPSLSYFQNLWKIPNDVI